jgi:hypothetical protein
VHTIKAFGTVGVQLQPWHQIEVRCKIHSLANLLPILIEYGTLWAPEPILALQKTEISIAPARNGMAIPVILLIA